MKTVLVVSPDPALEAQVSRAFTGASVFLARTEDDGAAILDLVDVDVVLLDARAAGNPQALLARVRSRRPGAITATIGADDGDRDGADFALAADAGPRGLEQLAHQVVERHRLLTEIAALRTRLAAAPAGAPPPPAGLDAAVLGARLRQFARAFAAGFELPRVLETFLDAVGEMMRPTRSALLLAGEVEGTLQVAAHRRLAPQIVASARLRTDDGLGRWLATQGRPAALSDLADPALARELALFGGLVAIPLAWHGHLVGVLVVGPPIVGEGYARHEIETLFDLATNLAATIEDIRLHHQVRREKEFNERILAHMSSGVITIGRDERVRIMNRRAEEILHLPAAEVIGQDLRTLPSPLGDKLFEALVRGEGRAPEDLQLAYRSLCLRVSTYPIGGDDGRPVGAALVFEDRTAARELELRKRQADEFQLLARVVARIADEIKNPLVSINTFVDLLGERYDDADFRKLFESVVRRDVRRLVQVFEKLAGLVGEGAVNSSTVDVHSVVDDVVSEVEAADEALGKRLLLDVGRDGSPQMVRVDVPQLRKALSYLVWFLTHTSPGDEARVAVNIGRHSDRDTGDVVRILVASRTASVPADRLERLFDPVQAMQESLIDVGPAVSQRLIEAQGGRLHVRQGRHEVSFQVTLPAAG